jgi:RNA polymerase sigma factor (sigma-70 family)
MDHPSDAAEPIGAQETPDDPLLARPGHEGADSTSARFLGYAARLYRTFGGRSGASRSAGGGRFALPLMGDIDVDDLVQETFARAFHRSRQSPLDQGQDLGPYLAKIARNLCIDLSRRRTRTGRAVPMEMVDLDGSPDDRSATLDAGDSIPATFPLASPEDEDPDATATLVAYLAELPPDLRLLYETRYVRGLSQRQAAADLALTRRQIRTLETRLLQGAARAVGVGPRPRRRAAGVRVRLPSARAERPGK